jgi:hypothetical protein
MLFDLGRKAGGTVGYAHFRERPRRTTLFMDLALGRLHFLELFQFGVLAAEPWYELLNAGFQITGIAGSDFPVYLSRLKPYPRWVPLLGPERALVKAGRTTDLYEAWADGVRAGKVILSNGPIVELSVDEAGGKASATAAFFRPLEVLEIVRNGEVIAAVSGDGARTRLSASVTFRREESCWLAARVRARKEQDEPDIQAHTNPTYVLQGGKPVMAGRARQAVAELWQAEVERYRTANLVFPSARQREEFFSMAERALAELRRPLDR